MGAFVPLMENGGNGDHVPWAFDKETVEIYRKFVNIHYELLPFFYTAGSECYDRGISVMKPLTSSRFWIDLWEPKKWEYILHNDILVSPIVKEGNEANITIPKGSNWMCWWSGNLLKPGKYRFTYALDKFPVFLR